MKKLVSVLFVSLLVGGLAFAADPAIKFSGYVNSGLKLVSNSADTTFQNYASDYDAAGTWGKISGSYTSDMAGFKVGIATEANAGTVIFDSAYGWGSPVAGLKFFAGKGYSDAFDGVDDKSKDNFSTIGLSATYGVAGFSAGGGIVLSNTATADPTYVFGVAYAMDKMFDVRFSAVTDVDGIDNLAASAKFIGVANLLVSAGYYTENMSSTATGTLIDATVKYTMGALYAQVVFYDYLDDEWMKVTPKVGYTINDMVSAYGQVTYETESADNGVTNPTTTTAKVGGTLKFDANTKVNGSVAYDTDTEATTVVLDFVFSF